MSERTSSVVCGTSRRNGMESLGPAYRPYRLTSDSNGERNARRLGERLKGMHICQGVYQPVAARGPNL
jgi:hypothetical protein